MKKTIVVDIDAANVNAILQARNSFTASRTLPGKVDALAAAAFFASNFQGATALIKEGVEMLVKGEEIPDFETAVDLLIKAENLTRMESNSGFTHCARSALIAALIQESKKFYSKAAVVNIFRHVLDEHDTAAAALDMI